MDAPEDLRVEACLEVVERPVVGRAANLACNYGNRLVGQGRKDDFLRPYEHEPLAHLDGDLFPALVALRHHFDDPLELTVQIFLRCRTARPEALPGPLDGQLQAGHVDRLEEVVHRIDLERLDRMLVVGGDEDHAGRLGEREHAARNLEAGQAGHLDVEEHEVRIDTIEGGERLESIAGLCHDFNLAELSELVTQLLPGELLVVDDDGAQRAHAVIFSASDSSGTSMLAQVPLPGSLVSLSW